MQKKYDIGMRLWHWLNAVVMFGVIITVFLRDTFLDKHNVADILTDKLQHFGITISPENAILVAKAIREPMWQWHIYLGFGIFGLWIMRMFLFQTISGRINYMHLAEENLHKKMVKLGYIGIYIATFLITISGIAIYYHDAFGISKDFAHDIKELHEALFYGLLAFIPLHIIGVTIAENQDEKGIVSDMINGGELLDA